MNCGIYKITNTINSKVYIGSSISIERRWKEHLHSFRNKEHYNPHLQNAWNKYGQSSFVFKVLLYCDKENLLFYEDRAIDQYKSLDSKFGYNIRPAERRDLTGSNYEEMRQKMSDNHANFLGKNHPKAKSVAINGIGYNSIIEAAKDLGINYQTLVYRLKKGTDLNKKVMRHPKGKNHPAAKAVTINGKCYNTIKEASLDLGMNYGTLKNRLKKGINLNKPIQKGCIGKNNTQAKPIIINKKQYESLTEAANSLHIDFRTIKKKGVK